MRTLHRYILREMVATIGIAVLICTGLLLLGNLLKEILGLLISGQATLGLVMRGIGLLVPFILSFALPMGALTAALLVFGRLSADQELTAARANGISLVALSFPVLLLGAALCGVCAWINLEVAPRCRAAYKGLFAEIARGKARTLIPAGRFVTDIPGFVIYAERIGGDEIEEVLFFQMQNGRKVLDVRAPRARIEMATDERELRLTFLDGRALKWFPETADTTNELGVVTEGEEGFWQPLTVNEIPLRVALPAEVISGGMPSMNHMTFRQLRQERAELRRLGIEELTPLDVQLHRQVAFSFASFGFALVGIPLGVRGHRRETSVGVAFAIGLVLVYYGFLVVAQMFQTRADLAPWLIVWIPNLLFQLGGSWLLWRVNRGR